MCLKIFILQAALRTSCCRVLDCREINQIRDPYMQEHGQGYARENSQGSLNWDKHKSDVTETCDIIKNDEYVTVIRIQLIISFVTQPVNIITFARLE